MKPVKTAASTVARVAIPIETGTIRGAISKIAPRKHRSAMRNARKLIGEIIISGAKTEIAPETVAEVIAKALMRGANL